jgi:hypothetical protein
LRLKPEDDVVDDDDGVVEPFCGDLTLIGVDPGASIDDALDVLIGVDGSCLDAGEDIEEEEEPLLTTTGAEVSFFPSFSSS